MFCSKCGHKIQNEDFFCGNCGNPLKDSSSEPNAANESIDQDNSSNQIADSKDLSVTANSNQQVHIPKTIEQVTLDYIAQNKPPAYYAYGNLISPSLLKTYKVNLEADEKPLLMLKAIKAFSFHGSNISCKSSITITSKKIHYMTPKKGVSLMAKYLYGSFDIQNLESLNFGSKRNTLIQELYIGHPLLINGNEIGLIQFNVSLKEDLKECFDNVEKKYSDNVSLNYILGLFDAFAAEGIINNPVEKKSWNEDDSPASTIVKALRFIWSIISIFIK